MLVTSLSRDVGGSIIMLATFVVMLVIFPMYLIGHQHPESVTNRSNLSPTYLVYNIRHQHQFYPRCLLGVKEAVFFVKICGIFEILKNSKKLKVQQKSYLQVFFEISEKFM